MAKTFTVITESKKISAVVGQKTTLINASQANLYLTDDDTDNALQTLPTDAKQAVLNSLYAIAPGASKSLAAGTYNLSFSAMWSATAVIVSE